MPATSEAQFKLHETRDESATVREFHRAPEVESYDVVQEIRRMENRIVYKVAAVFTLATIIIVALMKF